MDKISAADLRPIMIRLAQEHPNRRLGDRTGRHDSDSLAEAAVLAAGCTHLMALAIRRLVRDSETNRERREAGQLVIHGGLGNTVAFFHVGGVLAIDAHMMLGYAAGYQRTGGSWGEAAARMFPDGDETDPGAPWTLPAPVPRRRAGGEFR